MNLLDNEQNLFDEGIVLSTDKLIPSKVRIDDDEDEDYKFSADLYATTDEDDSDTGYMHLRVYDGTTEDFDPSLTYEGKKSSEVILEFTQEGDEDDNRFVFKTKGGAKIIFIDGEVKKINTPSELNGLSLIFASRIFFIDVIRFLLNSDNSNYDLS